MKKVTSNNNHEDGKKGAVSTAPNLNYERTMNLNINNMYKVPTMRATSISRNESYIAETIEQKIHRVVNNKEPIKDGAPLLYTERSEGVRPEYDIRTDRWEIAVEAMDKVDKSYKAQREQRAKTMGDQAREGQNAEGDGIPTGQ